MKFPFPFKSTKTTMTSTATTSTASSWRWPTCTTIPRTLSFRSAADYISAAYLDDQDLIATATPHDASSLNPESAVISGLRSERLFFEPGATSSILEVAGKADDGDSVAMVVMDSTNPFVDFRVSMEEMVEACDLVRDWGFLEELLGLYLRVNDESNHGYIVGAFVDLLVSAIDGIGNSSSAFSSSSAAFYSSSLSFSSSSTEDQILFH